MSTEVMLIDDGSLAMRGVAEVLQELGSITFVGTAGCMRDVPVPPAGPRMVLIVDPFVHGEPDPVDLGAASRHYAVLVVSAYTHPSTIQRALALGVSGFVSKAVDAATLIDAISAVAVGGLYLGPLASDLFGDTAGAAISAPALEKLTPRERDVLLMVAQGLTHRQIGFRLRLSKATVDTYVHRVRQKVGPVNKAGLTRLAIEFGLLSDSAMPFGR